jgi:hypothetical protein
MITKTREFFSVEQNKSENFFLPLLLIFLAISLILLPFFQYHLNPDGICYMRIAHYYAQGNFNAAVNGCWSPLICWLLAPLYKIGVPDLIGFRFLNLFVACLVLYKIYQIVTRYCGDIPQLYKVCIIITCALELLILHFNTITPDLFSLYLLLFLLEIYLSGEILQKPLLVGLLGGLLYFAKAYSFYFFGAFIFLFAVIKFLQKQFNKKAIFPLIKISFIFFLLSSFWVAAMHWKYNQWMISSTSGYALSILDENGFIHQPFEYQHVLRPLPYPEAYSAWEDVPWLYKHSGPHEVYHKNAFVFIKLIFINCRKLILMLFGKYPFSLLFFIPLILFFVRNKINRILFFQWPALYKIMLFAGLYVSGYLLISIEPRYVWILLITSTIILFRLLYFVGKDFSENFHKIIAFAAIVPFLITTVFYISTRININEEQYDLAMKIKKEIPAESNIASYRSEDLWNHLFMSSLHDYGGIASYKNDDNLMNDLAKYKIGYIVLFSEKELALFPKSVMEKYKVYKDDGEMIILQKNQ